MKFLSIPGKRTSYAPINDTLTVKELIDYLQHNIDIGIIKEDTPIYLNNDYGDTYGTINKNMQVEDYTNYDISSISELEEDF